MVRAFSFASQTLHLYTAGTYDSNCSCSESYATSDIETVGIAVHIISFTCCMVQVDTWYYSTFTVIYLLMLINVPSY